LTGASREKSQVRRKTDEAPVKGFFISASYAASLEGKLKRAM
jgi:hypothetical protein